MNETIFWYWFKRIAFITFICMLMYAIYTWISPEREFHTKYTNTEITQIIHPNKGRDIVKWSGIDKDGIKHDFEGGLFKNHIDNLCDVTLDDIKSGTVYVHKCGIFVLYLTISIILFVISIWNLTVEADLSRPYSIELVHRLKHRIEIAKCWFIFWGYPSDKVNTAIKIYELRFEWDNTCLLISTSLINVIQAVNEIMKNKMKDINPKTSV